MATFARGYWTVKSQAHNAAVLTSIERTSISTTAGRLTWILTASDTITLRGIPAIGRGVEGAIRHTRPDKP
jgi:hypothetical protein